MKKCLILWGGIVVLLAMTVFPAGAFAKKPNEEAVWRVVLSKYGITSGILISTIPSENRACPNSVSKFAKKSDGDSDSRIYMLACPGTVAASLLFIYDKSGDPAKGIKLLGLLLDHTNTYHYSPSLNGPTYVITESTPGWQILTKEKEIIGVECTGRYFTTFSSYSFGGYNISIEIPSGSKFMF
jgi:hypothetical protein